jgi:hypothetical protein
MCFFKRKKGGAGKKLTVDSKLSDLLNNPDTKAVLEKHIPASVSDPRIKTAARFLTLRKMFSAAGDRIDQSKLPLIEADLNKLQGE